MSKDTANGGIAMANGEVPHGAAAGASGAPGSNAAAGGGPGSDAPGAAAGSAPTGRKVKFVGRQEIPDELYADGVGSLHFGRNVVKLDLYRVLEFDRDDAEVRQLAHRVVLPITAIPELVRVLQNFGQVVKDHSSSGS
ncbi:hypothetical protein [Acuticoccus yangtzensis]|uniref:hypothetical protein n=1 Tax=Acuticoccus yangtzensis TaxID=1443441 RepID=UPI00094964C6|nr:hypothetical protein [Acuticoccus yangtzensis]